MMNDKTRNRPERKVKCPKCGHEWWTKQEPDKYGYISCKCDARFKITKKEEGEKDG